MLEGLRHYYDNGSRLLKPSLVASATEDYRQESDIIGDFIRDRCLLTGEVSRASLRIEYQEWCRQQNEKPVSSRRFTECIRGRSIGEKMYHGERFWTGLSIAGQVKFS
jgi:putative DNA primase/helicase